MQTLLLSSRREGMNDATEPVRQVGLLYDRWRHHLSPPPQFRHGLGGEGNIFQPSAPVVSAAIAHKTFGPSDLTSTYSVCTRRGRIPWKNRSFKRAPGVGKKLRTSKLGYCLQSSSFSAETEAPPTPDPHLPNECDPSACVLPDCFCSSDGTRIPGGLEPSETPQMILLSFDGAVNSLNFDHYRKLLNKSRTNPNGCPIKGTFFVSHEYTSHFHLQKFFADGHEVAVHSIRISGISSRPRFMVTKCGPSGGESESWGASIRSFVYIGTKMLC
ncbi:UNVERIFIED_CONTAM: hypothetical protein NCL1_41002 [Trichonephila clavipes]